MFVKKYQILAQAEDGQGLGAGGDNQEGQAPEQNQPQKDDDTEGIRGALKKERERARSLEAQLKKFQGIDPEKYATYEQAISHQEQERQERERKELEAKGNYEKAIATEREKHAQQQQTLSARVSELEKQLQEKDRAIANKNISVAFQNAFIEAGGIPGSVKFLQREIESYLRYDEKEDRVMIVDPKTDVEVSDKKGNAIGLKEWIEGFKQVHANLFKAENNANGSGAPSRNGAIINNKIDTSKMSSIEKMRIGRGQL